eukprot:1512611-Rhodomonas_salina.1
MVAYAAIWLRAMMQCPVPRNQTQETALVQLVLKLRFLVLDFGVDTKMVNVGVCVRGCAVMSGTDIPYGATRGPHSPLLACAMFPVNPRMLLRAECAMPGTDMRCP